MNSRTGLPQPFDLVAKALGCPPTSLSIDSAMYRDHGWDSFGHLSVILALEKAYAIQINDDEVQKYTSMRAIQELYKERSTTR
jgi:acyl carrier protein